MHYQQTPTPQKKTNWGMIILIIILVPVIILGTLFGIKYLNNDNNGAPAPSQNVPQSQATNNQNSNQPVANNTPSTSSSPVDFVKTLEGKINNKYDVVMRITANNGQISGTYYYKSVGKDLKISGNIDAQGRVNMTEYDEKGNMTGQFTGSLNGNKIDGTWKKPSGGSTMSFYLIESNTNYDAGKKNASASNPANFRGFWTSEGDVTATGILEIDITQTGSELSGTIEYDEYSGGSSGLLSIDGKISGNTSNFEIYDSRGREIGKGKITTDGKTITFTTGLTRLFPSKMHLYKR